MNLGDRVKTYEKTFLHTALKRTPLIIRVDGKAFHTFTKNLDKPFDKELMNAMVISAEYVANNMQGFKMAYIQSDEATFFLSDYDTLETEGWFDYKLPKLISISAAMMTGAFNKFYPSDSIPVFDSRAFSVPVDDVANVFLWRAKDWERNSLQMYCRAFFSHKELHKKNREMMHEMLHGIGKNWSNDLSNREKNGTFLINSSDGLKIKDGILPTFDCINTLMSDIV